MIACIWIVSVLTKACHLCVCFLFAFIYQLVKYVHFPQEINNLHNSSVPKSRSKLLIIHLNSQLLIIYNDPKNTSAMKTSSKYFFKILLNEQTITGHRSPCESPYLCLSDALSEFSMATLSLDYLSIYITMYPYEYNACLKQ